MKVTPYETYQTYLSMKSHFTNPKYDFFKYGGKSRATVSSFNKRKDKYWFEKTSRKYSDQEILDFLLNCEPFGIHHYRIKNINLSLAN